MICASTVALLCACSATAPGGGAGNFLPEAKSKQVRGDSWMDAGAVKADLLYVSNSNGTVNVYKYWQNHALIGVLTDAANPMGECTDQKGNVYVVDNGVRSSAGDILEYAHGGKTPLRVLEDGSYRPSGCAVDPKSGDLAVANIRGYYNEGSIAIYRHAKGKPVFYTDNYVGNFASCAYDRHGNLLATNGTYDGSSYYSSSFAWLPRNGIKLENVSFSATSSGYGVFASGVGWDGKYWTLDSYALYEAKIVGGKGVVVNAIGLTENDYYAGPYAFYIKQPAEATQVVGASLVSGNKLAASFWKYPAGGDPYATITHGLDYPTGFAISLKP